MDANMQNEREEVGTFENMTGLMEDTGDSMFRLTVSSLKDSFLDA
jgi:hypothetical protein